MDACGLGRHICLTGRTTLDGRGYVYHRSVNVHATTGFGVGVERALPMTIRWVDGWKEDSSEPIPF